MADNGSLGHAGSSLGRQQLVAVGGFDESGLLLGGRQALDELVKFDIVGTAERSDEFLTLLHWHGASASAVIVIVVTVITKM